MKKERNITKRVQEFEKTFDFVNSHLLKGVVTMAELTKTENRQPMGKIKPTDKMVMMPSLFDGTKPATSKEHYKRFNLYINFQTKSGHLTDPVKEGIDLERSHNLQLTVLYMSLKLPHFAHHNVVPSLISRVQLCCIQYRMRGYGLISRANYRLVSHV